MKYSFNLDELSIIDRILEINNVNIQDLDVSNYVVDNNIEIINLFKEKLLLSEQRMAL